MLLLFNCSKKDNVPVDRKINSTTTIVMTARNQDNQISVVLVDVTTDFEGSNKISNLKGRAIKFNFTNSYDLDNKIDAFFAKIKDENVSLKDKNLSAQLEEDLKLINGFVGSADISKEKILEMVKNGNMELALNHDKENLFLEFLASLIATPAYAQTLKVDKLVADIVQGVYEQVRDCAAGGVRYNINQDCSQSIQKLIKSTGKLWDFIAEEVDKAMNPKDPKSANDLFNNMSNVSNSGDSPVSSGSAGGWGDPHIYTFDGSYYDFQAVGEFIVCKSTVDNFNLQIRQEEYNIGIKKMVSVNTAIALNTGSDIISIQHSPLKIYVNKKEVSSTFTEIELSASGKIKKNGNEISIDNNKGDKLTVNIREKYLDYVLGVSKDRKGKITGLLGNFDGDNKNDLITSTGSVANPGNFKEFYSTFANSWRITNAQSLFQYEVGKNTESFTDKNFPSQEFEISPAQYQIAYKACTEAGVTGEPALSSCIYDVAITQNLAWAKNYTDVQSEFNTSGLVAYYPFSGSVEDESGNNNDGQVFGASLTKDRNGKLNSAYTFAGSQQFIRVPNSLELHNLGQQMTISSWVLIDQWQSGAWGAVACKATASKPHFQFQLWYDSAKKKAFFESDGRHSTNGGFEMELKKWYHLVLMLDGKIRRFYVNGELIGIDTNLPLIQPDYSPLEFGRDFYSSTEYHIGALDEIRIYNRALSLSEIRNLYKLEN